jgi:uracil-DNA glycosylase family 4
MQQSDDAANRLDMLRRTYQDCQGCDLASSRRRVVFGHGRPGAPLFLLAERIGEMDEETGRPFSGPAGDLLTRLLAAPQVEIPADDIYLSNLVLCRASNNRSPRVAEMRACRERLAQEMQLVAPQVLVLLGRLPWQQILGGKGALERQRGWHRAPDGLPAYVTFNPASALHGDAYAIRRKKLLIYEDWQAIAAAYRGFSKPGE